MKVRLIISDWWQNNERWLDSRISCQRSVVENLERYLTRAVEKLKDLESIRAQRRSAEDK